MFLAVIPKAASWWQQLAFNWFDVALLAVLAFGFWRGRRRGMTKEMLPTLQWLTIMLAAGLGHPFVSDLLQQQGIIKQVFGNQFSERTAALMSGYLIIALIVFMIFTLLQRKYNPKLEGSSFFGGNEYYWGVVAGLIRYLCMVLVALALLNAPYYSLSDIDASKAYRNKTYGGGMEGYNGDFIPQIYDIQASIFRRSLVGPLIKDNLSVLLICTPVSARNHQSY